VYQQSTAGVGAGAESMSLKKTQLRTFLSKNLKSLKIFIQIYVGTLFLDPSENFIWLWRHGIQRQDFWILEIVDHRRVNRFGSEPSPESLQKGDFAFVQGG